MHDEHTDSIHEDTKASNAPTIKTMKVVYPQLYSYTLPDLPDNHGSQKIGFTDRKDVEVRIREQTHTAAIKLRHETQWSAPAFYSDSDTDFKDKDFHKFLIKSGVENRTTLGSEWFYFNGTPEKSKQLLNLFRDKGFSALQSETGTIPYTLRREQREGVSRAKEFFETHEHGEFLWNAKPRFGKTLASYDLAKQLDAHKVLIVTNRPAIANSWFDDFQAFIDGYYFISDTSTLSERPSLSHSQYLERGSDKPQITFLSLQDLKGSKYFGGDHEKLQWVADLEWDLLVIDEAHEGVDTSRTDAAFNIVNRKNTLHLSGTPFKALANNKFPSEAIYNWTYLDEQKAKKAELATGEAGDHTDLPDLNLYTYRISQMITQEVNEGVEIDEQTRDFAFDLNEFFATKNQKFIHEADVKEFLKNLTKSSKYPFSTPELRDELRHTFWYVGNRVESVKALEQLLKDDAVFKDYRVVVAAGDGKSFDEEESDFKGNEKSYDKVKKAIKENPKTITLSCGQLTTGVTIKEWSAVLMLTDIKTPAQYMQAAFRAQNPYKFTENGVQKVKKSAYLFDFAPTRVLEIYDTFANALNPKAVNGEITGSERKENIKELLNFFPVISEDIDGRMVELDAEKVLTFPNALAATEIVQARFMTNLLFNDNIKGVFTFPKEVEDILNKLPVEKNKRIEEAKAKLDLDDARKVEQQKQVKVNENTGIILGEKIYRSNIDRVVDKALSNETIDETLETLSDKVFELIEPVIAKYKEVYHSSTIEIEEMKKEAQEQIKITVAEYENSEVKDSILLKESLAKIIESDLVQQKVEQQEEATVASVQKTKEDEIRDRLRSFTRTIPMFIMANSSKETITIDTFDQEISDADFVDLTNISKEEFHKLRDGFTYEENGERKTFGGVFERYKFNASIAEFVAEKHKRANYFKTDEDIFELIPNQKNNQIFTPRKVVKMMIELLEREQPELFKRTDSKFIDLYMKSGLYITEIVKKLFANTRHNYTSDDACIKNILENQVYGLAPTGTLYGITQSFIFGFDSNHTIENRNFVYFDLLPEARKSTAAEKITKLFGNGGSMIRFDAVVGNPPYQINTDTNFAMPVYHLFIEAAKDLQPNYVSLVHPARFLFNAGATPKEWNRKMLNDPHLSVPFYEAQSQNIFSGVDIKGGVAITLWSKNSPGKGLGGTFIAYEQLRTTIEKVGYGGFDKLVGIKGDTKLTVSLDEKYPREMRIASNYFERFPEVFLKTKDQDHQIEIIGLEKANKRTSRFINESIVSDSKLNKWKIFIPESNGSGAIGETLSTPLIGKPLTGCTYTFLQIGPFDTESEAKNCMIYIKTKFCRALLGTLKTTQHNPSQVWKNIPLQDFTDSSQIDWSQSVQEVDRQLYLKYRLNQDEIDFIESHVKEMK